MDKEGRENKLKRWSRFFYVIGGLGILELITASVISLTHSPFSGLGIVGLALLYALNQLFGAAAGSVLATVISALLQLSLLWLVLGYAFDRTTKKREVQNYNDFVSSTSPADIEKVERKRPSRIGAFVRRLYRYSTRHRRFVLVVMLAVFLFYWFQYRPSQIISHCSDLASRDVRYYNILYTACIHDAGL